MNNKQQLIERIAQLRATIENQTVMNIIQAVEDVTKISYAAMYERTRIREVAQARQLCWWMMWEHCRHCMSLKAMGSQFGNMYDHSTIIHGRYTIADQLEVSKYMRDIVQRVQNRFDELEGDNIEFDAISRSGLGLAEYMEFSTVNVRDSRMKMLI